MTAPERIWIDRDTYWTHTTHKADKHEYILHTRAALAASPLVQDERLRSMRIVYQRMEIIAASDMSDGVKIAILLNIIKDIHNASPVLPLPQMPETVRGAPDNGAGGNIGS